MPETDPLDEYHVLANRLRDRYYQDFTAELQARMSRLMGQGICPEEASRRAHEETDGLRRQMAAELSDALLSAEADLLGRHDVYPG